MDAETFYDLPRAELARLVRAAGLKVLVLPVNGTRRWFMLEHPGDTGRDMSRRFEEYRDITLRKYVELFKLVFDQGIQTLLTPEFGAELLSRGETYARLATAGLASLATYPAFLEFYDAYQVRVRFYGDYRRIFGQTPYAYLIDLFDGVTQRTLSYDRHRLFYGICANDATETVAELAVQYFARQNRAPDRRTIVKLYYGEFVDPVDLFIGFDKFSAFDMPLLALGTEDLYFTVAPSLYMTERQLREILYDHLYTRRLDGSENWRAMEAFYRKNAGRTLGVGRQREGFWYPAPQVDLPPGF
jgi:tuberculosinol/isotuberculosinol synthase